MQVPEEAAVAASGLQAAQQDQLRGCAPYLWLPAVPTATPTATLTHQQQQQFCVEARRNPGCVPAAAYASAVVHALAYPQRFKGIRESRRSPSDVCTSAPTLFGLRPVL